MSEDRATPRDRVHAYHQRSKHHLDRYAASLGYLDWATQPDPFRTFEGAPQTPLPLAADGITATWRDLFRPGAVGAAPLGVRSIAAFLELSLGLTAWKQYQGNRWALRANPSSGNLHPTEAYLVLPPGLDLGAGVHHYVSRDHVLEQRAAVSGADATALGEALGAEAFLVGLSSIHWRESWKYGERAYRYCQHDVGHALGAVRMAAAALGWGCEMLARAGDDAVAGVLGLDRDEDFALVHALEHEHPDALLRVSVRGDGGDGEGWSRLAPLLAGASWSGRANPLSGGHVEWPAIDDVTAACLKEDGPLPGAEDDPGKPTAVPVLDHPGTTPAATLIRQRRSAVAMDGETGLSREAFLRMLDATLPRPDAPPFDLLPWAPRVHLGLFVHRVQDLEPGLYVLLRRAGVQDDLRRAMTEEFDWQRVPAAPEHLGLHRLRTADVRGAARMVSCHQEIAADGAFSLGMLTEYRRSLDQHPGWYRRLYWETGLVGQALYLAAEAEGVRATGIGCFFDDAFHQVLGLGGDAFQSLYHFTVGGPVDDPRLETLPPYVHLGSGRGASGG